MSRAKPLSQLKLRFCQEYAVDCNTTQAAIRAGYAESTAEQNGGRLLGSVGVREEIARQRLAREKRLEVRADKTLREAARIGFFDPRKLQGPDGKYLALKDMDDDTAACIAGHKVKELWEPDPANPGQRKLVGYLTEVKYWDKNSALQKLMQHLGLLDKDDNPLLILLRKMKEMSEEELTSEYARKHTLLPERIRVKLLNPGPAAGEGDRQPEGELPP